MKTYTSACVYKLRSTKGRQCSRSEEGAGGRLFLTVLRRNQHGQHLYPGLLLGTLPVDSPPWQPRSYSPSPVPITCVPTFDEEFVLVSSSQDTAGQCTRKPELVATKRKEIKDAQTRRGSAGTTSSQVEESLLLREMEKRQPIWRRGNQESEEAWPPSVLRVARVSRKPVLPFVPGCWACSLRTVDELLITAPWTFGCALPE